MERWQNGYAPGSYPVLPEFDPRAFHRIMGYVLMLSLLLMPLASRETG